MINAFVIEGVTLPAASSYNQSVTLMVWNAAKEPHFEHFRFASARVLAALPGMRRNVLSAALSRQPAFAFASKSLR
jgi:hypothetical protein